MTSLPWTYMWLHILAALNQLKRKLLFFICFFWYFPFLWVKIISSFFQHIQQYFSFFSICSWWFWHFLDIFFPHVTCTIIVSYFLAIFSTFFQPKSTPDKLFPMADKQILIQSGPVKRDESLSVSTYSWHFLHFGHIWSHFLDVCKFVSNFFYVLSYRDSFSYFSDICQYFPLILFLCLSVPPPYPDIFVILDISYILRHLFMLFSQFLTHFLNIFSRFFDAFDIYWHIPDIFLIFFSTFLRRYTASFTYFCQISTTFSWLFLDIAVIFDIFPMCSQNTL